MSKVIQINCEDTFKLNKMFCYRKFCLWSIDILDTYVSSNFDEIINVKDDTITHAFKNLHIVDGSTL